MLTKYRTTIDRLHDYLCNDPDHPLVQIHHSHIDQKKLFRARLIAWIYISVIYIWVLWEMGSITTNFIYLTLQGYFMTWLFYTAVLQDYWFVKIYGKQNHPCKKQFLFKFYRLKHYIEIIYEIALCFEVPITLVFWGFLFQILLRNHATAAEIIMNTNLHLGPFVCLCVELYYNNFSFPKRHFWVALFYGSGYLLINLAYSLAVKVIYEPIDWVSLMSYIIVLGSYVFTFGAHHFGRFAYRKWKAPKLTTRITEGLIQQIEPKQKSTQSTGQRTPSNTNKDFEISDRISEGRKISKITKDNEVLL